VIKGTDVQFGSTRGGHKFASFDIPWSKTTREQGASIVLTHIPEPMDPVSAIRHHLAANSSVPPSAPLFSFETADGGWSPMTKAWFMSRTEQVWSAAGLSEKILGHRFRIGEATELLLRGTPPEVVATQGRWKSQAFLEYWRRIELVLPLFISRAHFASRFAFVQDSMSSFRKKFVVHH